MPFLLSLKEESKRIPFEKHDAQGGKTTRLTQGTVNPPHVHSAAEWEIKPQRRRQWGKVFAAS